MSDSSTSAIAPPLNTDTAQQSHTTATSHYTNAGPIENTVNHSQQTDTTQGSLKAVLLPCTPVVATTFLLGPVAVLQAIYSKHFGLSLTSIATVLLIARLFDAVTDPLVGYWADRHYARTGNRKLFFINGAGLLLISSFFLYVPMDPDTVTSAQFLLCILVFFFAWTLFEIPHLAWCGEQSHSAAGKVKIYSLRAVCGSIGAMAFFGIPYLPIYQTTEITPETLEMAVLISGVIILFACLFSYYHAFKRPTVRSFLLIDTLSDSLNAIVAKLKSWHKPHSHVGNSNNTEAAPQHRNKTGFAQSLALMYANKPFLMFIAAFMCLGIGSGMMAVMYFFYIDNYLGLGDKFALISLVSMMTNLLSLYMWYKLSSIVSKNVAWFACISLLSAAILGFSLLSPGESSLFWVSLLMIISSVGAAAIGVLAPATLADIIDSTSSADDQYQYAQYFSIFTLATKANVSLGSALGLGIAGWYGFNPSAAQPLAASGALMGLKLSIAYVPAIFISLSLVFLLRSTGLRSKVSAWLAVMMPSRSR